MWFKEILLVIKVECGLKRWIYYNLRMSEIEDKLINKIADRKAYDKEYNSKYYKEHRNYWLDYHDCECGSRFNLSHKSRHNATKKHRLFVENRKINEQI